MPKYEVTYEQIERYVVIVEAESKDKAVDLVDEMVEDGSILKYHNDSDGSFSAYEA